jgi:hypothetical protein
LEGDFKSTKSDIKELRKLTTECVKKSESLERDVASIKTGLEEVQRTLKAGGRQVATNGAAGATRHSSADVRLHGCRNRGVARVIPPPPAFFQDLPNQMGFLFYAVQLW